MPGVQRTLGVRSHLGGWVCHKAQALARLNVCLEIAQRPYVRVHVHVESMHMCTCARARVHAVRGVPRKDVFCPKVATSKDVLEPPGPTELEFMALVRREGGWSGMCRVGSSRALVGWDVRKKGRVPTDG